jgi:opacity protein-like surface antigen
MKKLTLALVASTLILTNANAHISTGFYLGAHAGYDTTTATNTSQQLGVTNSGDIQVGSSNGIIGIHGGYGWVQSCLYVGGDFGYTFGRTKLRDSMANPGTPGEATLKRDGYFRAAFRAGYLFTPNTLLYITLGTNLSKWNYNDTLNNGFNQTIPGTASKNKFTFAPGVGLETVIHRNVYLRFDYFYEFGTSLRAVNSRNGNAYSQLSTIRSQSLRMGISYKF